MNLRIIPFYCKFEPIKLFTSVIRRNKTIRVLKKNDNIQLYNLNYIFKEGNERKEAQGLFFIYNHQEYKNIHVIFTSESSNFYHRALLPFIKSLYPDLILTLIKNKMLKQLLENFKTGCQYSDLIVTRASHKIRFDDDGKHKNIIPILSWPGMEYSEAFSWVEENNGWFQSIQFEAKRMHKVLCIISITRDGLIIINKNLLKVLNSFIEPICKLLNDNVVTFSNRSRSEIDKYKVKPLKIDFETDKFFDVSENSKFILTMRLLKTASISVIHSNPYVHITIIDYYDGSTFDLWILNSNEVIIVPQMKGTVQAIKRLINHIFNHYAEGEIKDIESIVQ